MSIADQEPRDSEEGRLSYIALLEQTEVQANELADRTNDEAWQTFMTWTMHM